MAVPSEYRNVQLLSHVELLSYFIITQQGATDQKSALHYTFRDSCPIGKAKYFSFFPPDEPYNNKTCSNIN